jgi:polysaccharide export outer membrane protein
LIRLLRFLALSGALVLVGCAGVHERDGASASLPDADPVAAALGRPEYRIGPSDLLTITVFQVEDLTRDVRVNNAGQISLPLIGAIDVAGHTVNELETLIASRYGARYLQNPQVSVFVKEFSSQRVTVGGAVKKPGIFPLTTPRLTLVQAVALSEGLSDTANADNVVVFRTVNGRRQFARFDLEAIEEGKSPDPEIMGEDVVVVDTSGGKVFLQNLIRISPLLAVWRYY